jgi:ADP-ribosylglycohydrolase
MKDKYRGCLLGGAVGDALGYPVEFLTRRQILAIYGEEGIRRPKIVDGVAKISDDTQMTLFTAEGLVLARERHKRLKESIYHSYLNWLHTQSEPFSPGGEGLLSLKELYDHRAPGRTCLGALRSGVMGGITQPINTSCGCGGVMRTAPVAIFCHAKGVGILGSNELSAEAAAITHGHVLGHMPSYVLSHMLYMIFEGYELEEAVKKAIDVAKERYIYSGMPADSRYSVRMASFSGIALLHRALELAMDENVCDEEAISELGEGWVAEETLAVAIYAAVRYKNDFAKAVAVAVNHDGDSDSTGAVTGNILGAYLGASAIPDYMTENLELANVILQIADDLVW